MLCPGTGVCHIIDFGRCRQAAGSDPSPPRLRRVVKLDPAQRQRHRKAASGSVGSWHRRHRRRGHAHNRAGTRVALLTEFAPKQEGEPLATLVGGSTRPSRRLVLQHRRSSSRFPTRPCPDTCRAWTACSSVTPPWSGSSRAGQSCPAHPASRRSRTHLPCSRVSAAQPAATVTGNKLLRLMLGAAGVRAVTLRASRGRS
jgi:hypothetical protein